MKKPILSLLCASALLAYQPAAPPPAPAFYVAPVTIQPQPQMGLVPAVAIGAAVVGVAAWGGLKIFNAIVDAWEHHLTNNPAPGVVFTGPPQLEGFHFEVEESGQ